MKQSGFTHNPDADPQQWIFGASKIDAPILQADRNWSAFANKEIQTYPWGDSYACAWFNTFDALQMLIKRKYGLDRNYSDRAMAKYTNVEATLGSDPHSNAEIIRLSGAPFESKWPSLRDIASFASYYAPLPQYVLEAFKDFKDEFELKHDTIRNGAEGIWDALQYSPVGVSVGWDTVDGNGYWYKAGNQQDFHWTVIVGGEYGKYFLVADSAEPTEKKIRWDGFKPLLAKRYDVTKRTEAVQISLMQRVIVLLKELLARLTPSQTQNLAPTGDETRPPASIPSSPLNERPEALYAAAKLSIGLDLSKQAPDERGCAESCSRVIRMVYPDFPIILSTIQLKAHLDKSPRFKAIKYPVRGCVSVFPTKGTKIGHCGVFGNAYVMSNTSLTGLWEANYPIQKWYDAAKKRGLSLYFYLPL